MPLDCENCHSTIFICSNIEAHPTVFAILLSIHVIVKMEIKQNPTAYNFPHPHGVLAPALRWVFQKHSARMRSS